MKTPESELKFAKYLCVTEHVTDFQLGYARAGAGRMRASDRVRFIGQNGHGTKEIRPVGSVQGGQVRRLARKKAKIRTKHNTAKNNLTDEAVSLKSTAVNVHC